LEERELVQRVFQGNEEAAREFVETYRDYMYRTCSNILGYRDPDAEDMVQEAFVIAFRKLKGFEFRAPLKAWLAQICAYLCFRNIRKRSRMVLKMDEEMGMIERVLSQDAASRQKESEDRKEKLDLIQECLSRMSQDCRSVVDLRDRQEKSYAEIGKVLRVPIGTVMSRLARCKEALKALVLGLAKERRS
jgi:RNA polymerase sigma-70 factor (ECF subfamily)